MGKVKVLKPLRDVVGPARLRPSNVVHRACDEMAERLMNHKTGKRGLSVQYLADKSGVSTSTLYRLRDNGRKPYSPHLKTVEFSMRALGLELTFVKKEDE